MTMARKFVTLIIAGAAVALAPSVATAASQLKSSYSSPLIGATVVGTVGNQHGRRCQARQPNKWGGYWLDWQWNQPNDNTEGRLQHFP